VNRDRPRLTTHLAILDVLLLRAAARIDHDLDGLVAVRAIDTGTRLGGSVAERKVFVQVIVFVGEAHSVDRS
jgi:hypothetical protein